jgi:hypothetical protein
VDFVLLVAVFARQQVMLSQSLVPPDDLLRAALELHRALASSAASETSLQPRKHQTSADEMELSLLSTCHSSETAFVMNVIQDNSYGECLRSIATNLGAFVPLSEDSDLGWEVRCENACRAFRSYFLLQPVVLRKDEAHLRVFCPASYALALNFITVVAVLFMVALRIPPSASSLEVYQQLCFIMINQGGIVSLAFNAIAFDFFAPAAPKLRASLLVRAIAWVKFGYVGLAFVLPPLITHCIPGMFAYFPFSLLYIVAAAAGAGAHHLIQRWHRTHPEHRKLHITLLAGLKGFMLFVICVFVQASFNWATQLYRGQAGAGPSVLHQMALETSLPWPADVPVAEFASRSLACRLELARRSGSFNFVTLVELIKIF